MSDLTDDNLRIVYKNGRAYGIRDQGGFILFFPRIDKYEGQQERFGKELQQQQELANFILEALQEIKTP